MNSLCFDDIKQLAIPRDLAFSRSSFEIWQRADFCCEYCDQYMFADPLIYSCFNYDHILPASKYKDCQLVFHTRELFRLKAVNTSNFALACKLCNSLKWTWDPNRDSGEPELFCPEMTTLPPEIRAELIARCRRYIKSKRRRWINAFETYRTAIDPSGKRSHDDR